MALTNGGLGEKNVLIICLFVSIAVSGVNICFTGIYDYRGPSTLFSMVK